MYWAHKVQQASLQANLHVFRLESHLVSLVANQLVNLPASLLPDHLDNLLLNPLANRQVRHL